MMVKESPVASNGVQVCKGIAWIAAVGDVATGAVSVERRRFGIARHCHEKSLEKSRTERTRNEVVKAKAETIRKKEKRVKREARMGFYAQT
jgi:hypothetical protein